MKKKEIRDRLFKVISDFSKLPAEQPLPSLEQWEHEPSEEQKPDFPEKREYPRKDVSIYGIFETIDNQFRASTKNVSIGGVLIDPETHLSIYEHIDMTFFHRKFNIPIRANGKVIRVDSTGAGIQFEQAILTMSDL